MIPQTSPYRTTAYLLIFGIVLAILIVGRAFLIPFTIAVLFSFLLLPISTYLEAKRFPRELAIIISLLISFTILGLLVFFLYYQIMIFVDDAPALREKLDDKIVELQKYISRNFNVTRWEQKKWYKQQTDAMMTSSGSYITDFFTFTGELLATITLLPIYIFFLTYNRDKIKKFICRVTPKEQNGHILQVVKRTAEVSQKYIKGLLIDIVILAI